MVFAALGLVLSIGSAFPAQALRPEPGGPVAGGSAAGHAAMGVAMRFATTTSTAPGVDDRLAARWVWPLAPRPEVVRRFEPPSSRYGAGHRGVDLAASIGQAVLAVAAGRVTHVGVIADRPTITVTHPDGIRSTYEPVTSALSVGTTVAAGDSIGSITADGGHCLPRNCLHLGALRDEVYLDPLTLLGGRRIRLLPLS